MYNQSVKERFIRECLVSAHTAKACEILFNFIEKYEVEWDADICTQSEETLQPLAEEIMGVRGGKKSARLIMLKNYVKWCLAVGIPNACDGMLKVMPAGIDIFRKQTVANPAQLADYLNKIFPPVEQNDVKNTYRCYYWLAYGGMDEEDILKVQVDDVDFTEMVVKYNDTKIPIYREAVSTFKSCVESTEFSYRNPNPNSTKLFYKDRAPGKALIRGFHGVSSIYSLRPALSRWSKRKQDAGVTDLKLSYFRVWLSGLFFRLYENEQMGIEPDFYGLVAQQMIGKHYNLSSGRNTIDAKARQLVADYRADYVRWKLAHDR